MRRDNVIRYTGFDVYIYISIRDYDRFNREREREVRFLLGKNGFIGILLMCLHVCPEWFTQEISIGNIVKQRHAYHHRSANNN